VNSENSERIQYRRMVDQAGFARVCHLVTLDTELSDGAVRLYLLLLMYARDKDNCWPGVERLAQELDKTERTIERRLGELTNRGLITRQQRLNISAMTWIEDLEEVYNPSLTKMSGTAVDNSVSDKNVRDDPDKIVRDMSLTKMSDKQETEKETDMNGDGDLIKEQKQSHTLLAAFGVNGPVAQRLAQTCTLDQVEGWLEYAADAKNLRDPVAFAVKMLRDGEPVPERRKRPQDDRQRYITGKYADLIEH